MRGTFFTPMERFQPALPMRGVTAILSRDSEYSEFQPALPMRGVTTGRHRRSRSRAISTRTPHAGSDDAIIRGRDGMEISTRTPHAGSDVHPIDDRFVVRISTRTPHAGSDPVFFDVLQAKPISTRTPHAGSDIDRAWRDRMGRISTRTPHAGSDRNIMRKIYCLDQHIAPIDKQGTRNKRVRHLYVTLFGANLTYVICELRARTMVLQCQEPFSFVRWLRTYMLNLRLIFASKTVESQTIFLRIDQLDELALDTNHRRSIGNAFEH